MGQAQTGRPRRRPPRWTARLVGQHQHPKRLVGAGRRSSQLSRARGQPAARRDLRGHVGAELRGEREQQRLVAETRRRAPGAARRPRRPSRRRGRPRPGCACRSSAAAAAPPSRCARGTRAARARRGSPRRPGTPGQTHLVAAARRAPAPSSSSSASEIDCITRGQLVAAVGARRGPRNRPRLIFAGAQRQPQRRAGGLTARAIPASARKSSGESRSARASAGWPSATSAARTCSRGRSRRTPRSASEPASVLRR